MASLRDTLMLLRQLFFNVTSFQGSGSSVFYICFIVEVYTNIELFNFPTACAINLKMLLVANVLHLHFLLLNLRKEFPLRLFQVF